MATIRNGPYLVIKRTQIYRNPWMSVHQDDVLAPDGASKLFGIIELGGGVAVLPMEEDGRVLLAREFKYAQEAYTTEVFCGAIDAGETPLAAARRELAEESGIAASEWIAMGQVQPYTTIIKSRGHLFIARGLSRHPNPPKGDDDVEVVESNLDEAYAMVRSGQIIHAPSCLLILLAYLDWGAGVARRVAEKR